jgi:uncharacterized protein (TIGR02284 family)
MKTINSENGNKTNSVLKELSEFLTDGIKAYKTASNETDSYKLKSFCNVHSDERSQFLETLNDILINNGDEPDGSGTFKGAIYRQWMDFKSVINHDDDSIRESCLYGDEALLKAYDEALDSYYLPNDVRQVIQDQRNSIKRSYNVLKRMKLYHYEEE